MRFNATTVHSHKLSTEDYNEEKKTTYKIETGQTQLCINFSAIFVFSRFKFIYFACAIYFWTFLRSCEVRIVYENIEENKLNYSSLRIIAK